MAQIEEALKSLLTKEGVTGYVVINGDGIPVKYHQIEYEKAVQYASLVSDLVTKTKQLLSRLITSGGNDFVNLRMRTLFHTQLIVTSANDYILVAIQKTRPTEQQEVEGQKA